MNDQNNSSVTDSDASSDADGRASLDSRTDVSAARASYQRWTLFVIALVIALSAGVWGYYRHTKRTHAVQIGVMIRGGGVERRTLGRTTYQLMIETQKMVDGGYSMLQGKLDELEGEHKKNVALMAISAVFAIIAILLACWPLMKRKKVTKTSPSNGQCLDHP